MLTGFPNMTGRAAWMYTAYELTHAAIHPMRTVASSVDQALNAPNSPFATLPTTPAFQAGWRVFDELTKRYSKPKFGIEQISHAGVEMAVHEEIVAREPFCNIVRFVKTPLTGQPKADSTPEPKVLIVAPMSGHFATLLRGTVKAMVPEHDVYVTDWNDARSVALNQGSFNLDDYVDYLCKFFRELGPQLNVIAVCQPSVPALAATALLAEDGDPGQPRTLTLMGGPIDVSRNPTVVNGYSNSHDISWFKDNVITYVPFPHLGAMRPVYPGFLQLAGFVGMNAQSHMQAFRSYFERLVAGDDDDVAAHRQFYDEYLSVMDITAEYFLQTVEQVFQRRALARKVFKHRGRLVDCSAIRNTTLMTVEGENDDICGLGQTAAAHDLCTSLGDAQRYHYVQPGVGHYGVFNGSRWRSEIQPRIRDMIRLD